MEVTEAKANLNIGNEDWPFAVPLVKKEGLWYFDTKQGREEILARRIGQNELSTIQVCLAYVDAQREYFRKDRDGDGLLEYAQKFGSDKGKKNGLYWPVKEGEGQSPLGPPSLPQPRKKVTAPRRQVVSPFLIMGIITEF